MRNRLFWKIAILYLSVLLLALVVLDAYVVHSLRREHFDSAFSQLESISRLAIANPPPISNQPGVEKWTRWFGQSGIRMTLIADDGKVLTDSIEDPAKMENHLSRPEVKEALQNGSGSAVRRSPTLGADLVYLAKRYDIANGPPLIIRLSLPVTRVEGSVFAFRTRLWGISLLILVCSGGLSLLFSRAISRRIRRLKDFSKRVADGDFRPLALDRNKDELADLSSTLNQTAVKLDHTIRTLREERNQSAAVLASMEEGVAVIGRDQRVIYCNSAFCRAASFPSASCQGRPVTELIRHSDLLAMIQKALSGNESIRGEVVVGSLRPQSFAATAAPIHSSDTTSGAVMVLHDITEIRRLERARRDFIANISHEFKTPLTAIQGFAETLLGGALDDNQNRTRFLEIIREHALRLGRLTDDLLKLAQIEAGQMQRELRPVAISEIIDPCMEVTRIKAKQKGLVLEANYDGQLPKLSGDVRSFQEILQNLLDNAVRYTSAGGHIRVNASVEGLEILLSVADTGIGIPKAEQDRIFERFYRADAARSRESGGTGLGLSIVKHLVESNGGKIRVDSEVGQGSTFCVYLPLMR